MKIRRTMVAIATASLLVIPATSAVAGGGSDNDCRDDKRSFEHTYGGNKHKDYKYAPDKECDKKDKDHRDKDRDKDRDKHVSTPIVKQSSSPATVPSSKAGRVLKTD